MITLVSNVASGIEAASLFDQIQIKFTLSDKKMSNLFFVELNYSSTKFSSPPENFVTFVDIFLSDKLL